MVLPIEAKIDSRPEWFRNFLGTAITHFTYTNHEELLETAIGAAGMIDEGKLKEAERLTEEARSALLVDICAGGRGGESGSTQVVEMIACGNYPADVTAIAKKIVQIKYPETNFVQ